MRKQKVSTVKKKVWEECKRIVRSRYAIGEGRWSCFTCDRIIEEKKDAHTGHFIPSGSCGAFLRYNLRNLRIQCYNCNINLGGNGAEYYRRMVREVGEREVNQLFIDKNKTVKADIIFYLNLLEEYTNL